MASKQEGIAQSPDREGRQRVLKGAYVVFNEQFSTVRDISSAGAKLHFQEAYAIPNNFVLVVELNGLKVDCDRV